MKIIDHYIIRHTLSRFAILLGLVLFALLMERLVRLLDLVATKNTPFDVIGEMMINLIPHYLGLALSASFFIAVLMAIIRLREDSELDALYASGVSLYRLALPVLGLSGVFCLLSALLIGMLQPHARYGYRNLLHFAGYGSWYNVLESGAFLTGIDDMTMTVGSISEDGRELTDVFFHERKKSGEMTTTTAERGRFDISEQDVLVLTLTNATQVIDGVSEKDPLVVKVKNFSREIETLFAPPPIRPRGNDERELTLTELWLWEGDPPRKTTIEEMTAETHSRVVRIVSILFLPLLALALGATAPKRQQGLSLAYGMFLLITYNEIVQLGRSLSKEGEASPWISLQLPMFLGLIFTLWMLWRAANHKASSKSGPLSALVDGLTQAFRLIKPARSP